MALPQNLGPIVTAIGGLGTAAFGLLDALKSVLSPINLIGFPHIRDVVSGLTPNEAGAGSPANSLPQTNVLATLRANWVNGTDLVSQKAIAKSLVKLHLSVGNAAVVAAKTNVDSDTLLQVATSMATGTALTQVESDAYSRFDLIVTAMLDEAYQHSDQVYRNWTRALAGFIAVILAVLGGWSLAKADYWSTTDMWQAVLIGMLATPLAPIAKDISSGLATAVNTLQTVKK
jgi:hypothetical protein